ncbi:unnamed protein product [Heligmosomoides polygyrus]|uniref:Saposin B-type domain-containing protein n=1 Tax=Heligmosomoides polygyrus TaxID=6339 RepID=A0A183GVT5_HELPZ|nr:unnamed protein product [Heligmosomoides polygyrus]
MAQMSKSDAKSLSCGHCADLQSFFSTMTERQEFAGFQHFVTVELKRTVCDYTGILATACDRLVEGVVPRVLSKFSDLSKSGDYCAKVYTTINL